MINKQNIVLIIEHTMCTMDDNLPKALILTTNDKIYFKLQAHL